jgi:hypothetical protein
MQIITRQVTMTGKKGTKWQETKRTVEIKPTLEEIYSSLTSVADKIQG